MTTYTLAGGCFWCLDAVFRRLKGVATSVCGYSGGAPDDASYPKVSSGTTGHAECVQVTFDESVLPSDILLAIFFLIHDPTSLNRQGADVGPQYRSAMFYQDDDQKAVFAAAMRRAQANWDDSLVTELTPLEAFYPAEAEHQDYFTHYPANGYCSVVIAPKIIKARNEYANWYKEV